MTGPISEGRSSYRIDGSRKEAQVGIDPTNRGFSDPIAGHPMFLITRWNALIQMRVGFSVGPQEFEGD